MTFETSLPGSTDLNFRPQSWRLSHLAAVNYCKSVSNNMSREDHICHQIYETHVYRCTTSQEETKRLPQQPYTNCLSFFSASDSHDADSAQNTRKTSNWNVLDEYLHKHGIPNGIEVLLTQLLVTQPLKPWEWMAQYICAHLAAPEICSVETGIYKREQRLKTKF
jgi:hypothetical protein